MLRVSLVAAAAAVAVAVLPQWAPTYVMRESTAIMPCNDTGLTVLNYTYWGLVDFDWSNGKSIWANAQPMNCEELLVQQAAVVKSIAPSTKVFVYRNLVKALPWYTGVREHTDDPAYADWFLPFAAVPPKPDGTYYVPTCDNNWSPPRCSLLYHDQQQTPQHPHGDGSCVEACDCGVNTPCGEYLWNAKLLANGNRSLADWVINEHVLGPTGLGNANISGFYFDDGWSNRTDAIDSWMPQPWGFCDTNSSVGGPTEIDYHCWRDMDLTQDDTNTLFSGWSQLMQEVEAAVIAAGGWSWQLFFETNTPAQGNTAQCSAYFRNACKAGSWPDTNAVLLTYTKQANGSIYPLPAFEQDLATFLLIRRDFAWLGHSWVGCNAPYTNRPEILLDYGVPSDAYCSETAAGSNVFTRQWTKASVTFDCNAWTGNVTVTA